MARNVHNGRCRRCGLLFVGMSRSEYNSSVTQHLRQYHDGAEPTDVMEPL